MVNKVAILSLEKRFKKFEREIKKIALKILEILKKKNISAEIYLAGDQDMLFLNKKFRGKNKPADILSFEEPEGFIYPKFKFKPIGEVYLNMTNDQQPKLLIHGFLHLFGYNHKNKNDRIKMEKKECLVIKKLRNYLFIQLPN